jgi:hypothetical protein
MFESGEKSMELREPMHSPSAGKASSCAVVGSRQSPMEKDKLRYSCRRCRETKVYNVERTKLWVEKGSPVATDAEMDSRT